MTTRVTLQDVAARAGVSRSAASLALRGDGRLAAETRERVLQAMDELGYVYNRTAAAMRTKQSRLVGIIVTNIDNSFFAQSVMAMEMELERLGYSSISASSLRSRDRQDQLLRQLREFGVDGVIVAAVEDTIESVAQEMEAAGLPCLSYTRFVESRAVDYVGPNDFEGGRVAAAHLLWHGSRTFAFVGSRSPSSASRLRRKGLMAGLEAAGLNDALRTLRQDMTPLGGYEAAKILIASGPLPDAIVCGSDNVAFGLFDAFREAGVAEIPRVIGFDDVELAAFSSPRLTTVSSHPAMLGRLAAATFVDRLSGKRTATEVQYIDSDLVIRASCGCRTLDVPPEKTTNNP
ncbi:LacI family DNA-binding transcriptional regulator [Arthrobacter glacialis]|uniref:LacI family transcriptional regulator n=1 Tax=Arthrobacter glacialis TaxID=1664 RepID=A0A2S3ZVL2_ARTGL|nr:LacI family DNA-binding transcriptional regulator [Arthrobacter glacialis]POH73124.1 LacI family transcriptional regulator [Arthrobacter glacialis]